jgi:fumarate reductase (CoM/CoB) subunit A
MVQAQNVIRDLLSCPFVDVLVVGGGLAAVRAAIEARRSGATVRVISKGSASRSGASAMAGQGYSAAFGHGGDADSAERHQDDTLRAGRGLANPILVRTLCGEAPGRIVEIEAFGAQFEKREGRFVQHHSGGHSAARSCVGLGLRASSILRPLRQYASSLGVRFSDRVAVVDLLRDSGRVHGVVGVDLAKAVPIVAPSGATVLATGGAGQLFAKTSNPGDLTGDGYAMVLDAGASLVDMEFYQFYPWRIIEPQWNRARLVIQPWTFTRGGYLVNRHGHPFMEAYDPVRGDSAGRDVVARAIFDEIRHGNGVRGGVRVCVSSMSPAVFRELNPLVHRVFDRHRIDPFAEEIIVAPEAHFAMGGATIDIDGRTGVQGLLAAGEVAGGVNGADRLGDNALSEALVFGARAGAAACLEQAAETSPDLGEELLAAIAAGKETADLERLSSLRRELGKAFWLDAGVIRNAEGLRRAEAIARRVREKTVCMRPDSSASLIAKAELVHLTMVGEALAAAAQRRAESRGAHYREDYPKQDDTRYARPIIVRKQAGGGIVVDLGEPHSSCGSSFPNT